MRLKTLGLSIGFHALICAMPFIPWPSPRDACDVAKEKLRQENPFLTEREIADALPECAKYIRLPTEWIEIGMTDNIKEVMPTPEPPKEIVAPEPVSETPDKDEVSTTDAQTSALEPISEELTPIPEIAEVETNTPEIQEEEIVIPDKEEDAPPAEEADEEARPVQEEEKTEDVDIEKPEPTPPKDVLSRPEKPKSDPFSDFLEGADEVFANEQPTPKGAPGPSMPKSRTVQNSEAKPQLRQRGAGQRTGNEMALRTAIRQKILMCWDRIDTLPNPERLDVVIQLDLDHSGYFLSPPKRIEPKSWPVGDRPMLTAIDRALRAARRCEPYDNLPQEYYDTWKKINVTIGTNK